MACKLLYDRYFASRNLATFADMGVFLL